MSAVVTAPELRIFLQATWIIGITCCTPQFHRYVWLLTREAEAAPPQWPHLIVPAFGALTVIGVVSLPHYARVILFTDSDIDGPLPARIWWVGALAETLIYVILPLQWGVYLVAIARRSMPSSRGSNDRALRAQY